MFRELTSIDRDMHYICREPYSYSKCLYLYSYNNTRTYFFIIFTQTYLRVYFFMIFMSTYISTHIIIRVSTFL
jgi:hypothetical protein